MRQRVLILATIPYTGTHTMFELLQMHPSVSREILAPELTQTDGGVYAPPSPPKPGQSRFVPVVLPEAEQAFLSMRDEPCVLVRGHLDAAWIQGLLLHRPFDFVWVTTYRPPEHCLESLYRRRGPDKPWDNPNPFPFISMYLLWAHLVPRNRTWVVPIEELATMRPMQRVAWFNRNFLRWCGLTLTDEMSEVVTTWDKRNAWSKTRQLAQRERDHIDWAIGKAGLEAILAPWNQVQRGI